MDVRNLLVNSAYFSDSWCFSIRVRLCTSFNTILIRNNSHHSCLFVCEIWRIKNELLPYCVNHIDSRLPHFCCLCNCLWKAFFLFIVLFVINSHNPTIGNKNDRTYAYISRLNYCKSYSAVVVLKTIGTDHVPNFFHSHLCCY